MGPETGILGTDGGGVDVVARVLLRVTAGPDRGLERLFEAGTLVVGTHASADLVLADATVSRHHAELALIAGGVRVKDLRSTNGTFVGDTRVESIVLQPGSEVRFGRTRVQLLTADAPVPEAPSSATRFGSMVGASEGMRRVFGLLERAAASRAPVWIHGAAGVGKTLAARSLHEVATERALPYAEGRGADGRRPAMVEVAAYRDEFPSRELVAFAHRGTIVLDRLDEASLGTQEGVRAAFESAERERLDVRWVSTSRRDPRALVEEGMLHRDLFFRLASVRIEIPPLRERLEDLPRLVDAILSELGYAEVRLPASELGQLRAHPLDGNVRELRHLIEETLLRSSYVARKHDSGLPTDGMATAELARLPFKEAKERLLDAFEKSYVAQLLERAGGNVSRAADEAGLDRNHLARLAKKHGLR